MERRLPSKRRMKHTAVLVLALLATSAPARAQVSVEPWLQPGTFMLTAELGGTAFTDFQRGQARPLGAATMPEFQRRVSARTSATLGAAASYWLGAAWGVRVGGAWTPTGFSVWNEESAQRMLDERGDGEPERYASLDVWMADVAFIFRFPRTFGRVAPYGLVGGSYVTYTAAADEELPPEARSRFGSGSWSAPAALFGVGGVIPLQRSNLLLTFELSNHLSRTPLDDRGRGEQFELSGVPLELEPDARTGSDGVRTTSNLRLVVGLTLPLR